MHASNEAGCKMSSDSEGFFLFIYTFAERAVRCIKNKFLACTSVLSIRCRFMAQKNFMHVDMPHTCAPDNMIRTSWQQEEELLFYILFGWTKKKGRKEKEVCGMQQWHQYSEKRSFEFHFWHKWNLKLCVAHKYAHVVHLSSGVCGTGFLQLCSSERSLLTSH